MAVSIVQHVLDGAGPGTSKAVTVAATGAGHLLVAVIVFDNTSTDRVSGVTDGTTPFTQVTGALSSDGGQHCDVWFLPSSNAGKTSITVTMNQSTFFDADIYEVSGFTTPAVDTTGVGIVNSGTATGTPLLASGASVTPTAPQFGVAGISVNNGGVNANPHAGNEFTSGGDIATHINGAVCSLITSSATAHQAQWDLGAGANPFTATTVFFTDTGGGGGGGGGPPGPDLSHQPFWQSLISR